MRRPAKGIPSIENPTGRDARKAKVLITARVPSCLAEIELPPSWKSPFSHHNSSRHQVDSDTVTELS